MYIIRIPPIDLYLYYKLLDTAMLIVHDTAKKLYSNQRQFRQRNLKIFINSKTWDLRWSASSEAYNNPTAERTCDQ